MLCLVLLILNNLWQVLYLPLSTLSSGHLSPLNGGNFHKSLNYNKKTESTILFSTNQYVLNDNCT